MNMAYRSLNTSTVTDMLLNNSGIKELSRRAGVGQSVEIDRTPKKQQTDRQRLLDSINENPLEFSNANHVIYQGISKRNTSQLATTQYSSEKPSPFQNRRVVDGQKIEGAKFMIDASSTMLYPMQPTLGGESMFTNKYKDYNKQHQQNLLRGSYTVKQNQSEILDSLTQSQSPFMKLKDVSIQNVSRALKKHLDS